MSEASLCVNIEFADVPAQSGHRPLVARQPGNTLPSDGLPWVRAGPELAFALVMVEASLRAIR